ncbi:hypothetical protein [Actinomadura sp. 7K507]|uniref:hypothetical protein n=1 Tax=Actinomadura sp. 7K507 TaxID=2530365 RepID=UPI00104C5E43|nr:hypothetical protein [Actinomadura sp. 7K507]TDC91415.1 hypothetical protein E1285_13085 [Actinomadura sp. 7K507]
MNTPDNAANVDGPDSAVLHFVVLAPARRRGTRARPIDERGQRDGVAVRGGGPGPVGLVP